jgi:hypothetical protein
METFCTSLILMGDPSNWARGTTHNINNSDLEIYGSIATVVGVTAPSQSWTESKNDKGSGRFQFFSSKVLRCGM